MRIGFDDLFTFPLRLRKVESALSKFRYTAGSIIPSLALIAFLLDGWLTPLPFYFFFVLIPTAELFLKPDGRNLPPQEVERRIGSKLFEFIAIATVAVCWIALPLFLYSISAVSVYSISFFGMIISMGMVGAVAINLGHELGHRRGKTQLIGEAALLISLENHFLPYHNLGHHKHVCTPKDGSTARKNQNYYHFFLQSQWFSYLGAWRLESEKLRRLGKRPYSLENRMVRATLAQTAVCSVILGLFGVKVFAAYLGAALIGKAILEAANYIEHYGLIRKRESNGRYESVKPKHSWNSDHILGRAIMFELSRHSDHHFRASKPYQILDSMEESPQLPTGYPGMTILALVPPLFFRVMNPRVES